MVQTARADEYSDANQLATERESAGKLDEAAEALETIAPQYPQDAVSYTHLDVYKRQLLYSALFEGLEIPIKN